jgi:hypothetical protein
MTVFNVNFQGRTQLQDHEHISDAVQAVSGQLVRGEHTGVSWTFRPWGAYGTLSPSGEPIAVVDRQKALRRALI